MKYNKKLKKIVFIILYCLFILNSVAFAQSTNTISFDFSLLWRDAQVLEATGLENSFLIKASPSLAHINNINDWFTLSLDFNFTINQSYSYKARYKEFFELLPIQFDYCAINFQFPFVDIIFGNIYSPDNDLEKEQIIPPLVRTVPDFSTLPTGTIYYNIISSKPRDIPILYDSAPFNLYDTGLNILFKLKPFYINLYILNGEEGFDSNSNKYYALKISFTIDNLLIIDLFGGIGKIGSVPFKSYADKLKLNFKLKIQNFEFQSVFSIFKMGLTHKNLGIFDPGIIEALGFDGLPFEPYDIPNLYNIGEPLYAYGFFVQMVYNTEFIMTRINLSYMDPDYRYEEEEIYKYKWRIFGDFGFSFIENALRIRLGASYTYNPVFLLGDQLYHYWESVHVGPVTNRLHYYTIFLIISYNISFQIEI